MDIKFDVYWKDEKTGEIEIRNNKLMRKIALTDDIFKFPFTNMESVTSILHYLSTRVFPYERADRDHLLDSMGLKEYNVYDILKVTKGVDYDDCTWFKFEDDEHLKFKDVHIKGRVKNHQ